MTPALADDLDAGPSCSFKSPVLVTPRCFSPSQEPLAFSSVNNEEIPCSPHAYDKSPKRPIHNLSFNLNACQQLFPSDEEDVDETEEVPCTQDACGTSPRRPIRNPFNVCQQLFPSDEEDVSEAILEEIIEDVPQIADEPSIPAIIEDVLHESNDPSIPQDKKNSANSSFNTYCPEAEEELQKAGPSRLRDRSVDSDESSGGFGNVFFDVSDINNVENPEANPVEDNNAINPVDQIVVPNPPIPAVNEPVYMQPVYMPKVQKRIYHGLGKTKTRTQMRTKDVQSFRHW